MLQYTLPGRRMRERGVSSSTLLLAMALGIVGFFVVPVVGAIVGFVLGIFVVELGRSRDRSQAWTRTKHALVAVLHSMGIELAAGLTVTALYVARRRRVLTPGAAHQLFWRRSQRSSRRSMKELLPFFLPPLARGSVVPSLRTTPRRARRGGVAAKTAETTIRAKPPAPTHIVVLTPTSTRAETGDDADGPDQPSPPLQRGEGAALHLRGELGVLGSESLLHLFEHLLLVL